MGKKSLSNVKCDSSKVSSLSRFVLTLFKGVDGCFKGMALHIYVPPNQLINKQDKFTQGTHFVLCKLSKEERKILSVSRAL